MSQLGVKTLAEVQILEREPVDADTYLRAVEIVEKVRTGGREALIAQGEELGDIKPGQPLVYDRAALKRAADALGAEERGVLERTAERIKVFAEGQRSCLRSFETSIPGGRAGHGFAPVETAGCYAPGGRFPLPSTVLMTAITARAAGVKKVVVASPKPTDVTLAAAGIAGADMLVAVGGAQVIGAMTFGVDDVPTCDVIVGPGNRWVTAAKKYVSGFVGIDMLAGPSELVVWSDETGDPAVIAADLLAQENPIRHHILMGLVEGSLPVPTHKIDGAELHRVEFRENFLTGLVGVATCGIYSPQMTVVQCEKNHPPIEASK